MYREYQPIAETLDLVWRYDSKIFGKKWRDWIPYVISFILFERQNRN